MGGSTVLGGQQLRSIHGAVVLLCEGRILVLQQEKVSRRGTVETRIHLFMIYNMLSVGERLWFCNDGDQAAVDCPKLQHLHDGCCCIGWPVECCACGMHRLLGCHLRRYSAERTQVRGFPLPFPSLLPPLSVGKEVRVRKPDTVTTGPVPKWLCVG